MINDARTRASLLTLSLLALLQPSPVGAQGQQSATASETPGETAPVECMMAAPSCFAECGAGLLRTAAGRCLPADRAGAPQADQQPLLQSPYQGPPAAAASPPQRTEVTQGPPCCRVPIRVTAIGIKNLGDHADEVELDAELRINGVLIGATPYTDALPAGDYLVEVIGHGGEIRAARLSLRHRQPISLQARYPLTLDAREQRQLEAYREGRKNALRKAEQEALATENAERLAELEREHAHWQQDTATDRATRSTHITATWISLGAGIVLTAAGVWFEVGAFNADDQARDAQRQWRASADPLQQQQLADDIDRHQESRDLSHVLGLTSLLLGAGSLITALVLERTAPDIPKEPPRADSASASRLQLRPWATASRAGVSVLSRF